MKVPRLRVGRFMLRRLVMSIIAGIRVMAFADVVYRRGSNWSGIGR